IVASLAGASAAGGYYLVSAHGDSDSGGPGADDNASGVAVVLELARLLSTARREGRIPPLPFAIRFVIWGEEYGSARALLAREGDTIGRCLGVVNIDQAGTG